MNPVVHTMLIAHTHCALTITKDECRTMQQRPNKFGEENYLLQEEAMKCYKSVNEEIA